MKKSLTFLLFALLLIGFTNQTFAQSKAINRFYAKYNRSDDDVVKLKLHRWMMGIGKMAIRMMGDNDEETELALQLAKSVKKGKLLVVEDSIQIQQMDVHQLKQDLHQESYEDLMTVQSKDSKVNILIREKDELIRNIVLLVHESDNFVLMSLKTKLTMDELAEIINNYQSSSSE